MTVETRSFAPLYTPTAFVNGVLVQQGQCAPSTTVNAVDATAIASTVFSGDNNGEILQIQIANKTSVWVHVNFGHLEGGLTVRAATINDFPVAPGAVRTVTVDREVNACSVFANGSPSGSTGVVFTRGAGV